MMRTILWATVSVGVAAVAQSQDASDFNWPQAAGPNLNWTVTTDNPIPLTWSAEKNQNIRWRVTLPETGQSGIAVWEDRLFLTTMKPLPADAVEKTGTDIVIYCFDANDGSILWQHNLAGDSEALSIYAFVYFQCFHFQGKRRGGTANFGPKHSLVRINVESGQVEFLEIPFPIPPVDGEILKNTELFYPKMTINSRGIDVGGDKRSGRTGWFWCFNGNVIAINQYLYFTFMSGRVQVIDGQAETFDETALTSLNDLGTFGETWSVNTPSYSKGRLYHRTMKELLYIEANP